MKDDFTQNGDKLIETTPEWTKTLDKLKKI